MKFTAVKWIIGVALYVIVCLGNAQAIIMNPDTFAFFEDNKAETFFTSTPTLAIETVDIFNVTFSGAEFGFYFSDSPTTLITIFDTSDAGGAAAIDFAGGLVRDIEDSAPQSLFVGSLATVGFYLTVGGTTVYTEAALNPGGVDFAATFPSILDPSVYMIGFELPIAGTLTTIVYEFVGGVKRVNEPGAMNLIIMGLCLLGFVKLQRSTIPS